MADKDILAEAKEAFKDAVEAESTNRMAALADVKFARLGEQWPDAVKREREAKGRPALVINKMPAFARQVVNDSRQNRPAISVTPVDSEADPKTAEVLSGLVRHIERYSCADIAYDTAIEDAVYGGVGYIQIGTDYASDTGFEQEVTIQRVVNPFSIYPDCDAESADGSDWKKCIHTVEADLEETRKKYKTKDITSWSETDTGDLSEDDGDDLRLARFWKVENEQKTLVLLSNGGATTEDELTEDYLALLAANGISPTGKTRPILVPRVNLYICGGNGVLDEQDWAGRYIPIVPVYGEEFWIEGKRYYKSLIRDAKDAQQAFNFWRTAATELVALQPKAPFIGPKGSFKSDAQKWASANTDNHAYIEYDAIPNQPPPQRQAFAGMPAGALQEALNASDDMKAILGIYDASLGARSNETSGKAIMARQREGDVSTFHFIDNLTRSIRQVGKVVLDLIPKVYDTQRIVRIVGKDETVSQVPLNQPYQTVDEQGQAIVAIHDVSVGRYDVSVKAGPSFTTQREEAAVQMTELMRAFPQLGEIAGDLIVKNFDWSQADEIAKRLEQRINGQGADPAQMQQMMQQAQQAQQEVQAQQQAVEKGKADLQQQIANLKILEANLKAQKAEFDAHVAQTQAGLQEKALALDVRGMQTDMRGQQIEQSAQASGEQAGTQIVQQALEAVAKQIASLEQKVSQGGQQPIIVPIPGGATRRQVSVKRGKDGSLIGDIQDIADGGIG